MNKAAPPTLGEPAPPCYGDRDLDGQSCEPPRRCQRGHTCTYIASKGTSCCALPSWFQHHPPPDHITPTPPSKTCPWQQGDTALFYKIQCMDGTMCDGQKD